MKNNSRKMMDFILEAEQRSMAVGVNLFFRGEGNV